MHITKTPSWKFAPQNKMRLSPLKINFIKRSFHLLFHLTEVSIYVIRSKWCLGLVLDNQILCFLKVAIKEILRSELKETKEIYLFPATL